MKSVIKRAVPEGIVPLISMAGTAYEYGKEWRNGSAKTSNPEKAAGFLR